MLVVKLYSETVHILSQMSESFDVGSHNNEPGMSLHHERSTYETFFYKKGVILQFVLVSVFMNCSHF